MNRNEIKVAFDGDHLTGHAKTFSRQARILARTIDDVRREANIALARGKITGRDDIYALVQRQFGAALRDLWNAKCAVNSAIIFAEKAERGDYESMFAPDPEDSTNGG